MFLLPGLLASPVAAAALCSFDDAAGEVQVSLPADGDLAVIKRAGTSIQVNGAACGDATVANTDLVTVTDTSGGATTVSVDLEGGLFAPGASPEADPLPEIEFTVDLGSGAGDLLVVRGTQTDDLLAFGADGINMNAAEGPAPDVDMVLAGVDRVELDGAQGNDELSSAGGAGTGAEASFPARLLGGAGGDRLISGSAPDVLEGGTGHDRVDYSGRTGGVRVTVGDGLANDGALGEADAVDSSVEQVIGGSGADVISGDASADLLIGGPGDDQLAGGAGDDELRGGDNDDLLDGGSQDDLLVGGPGNDTELGGGYNDVFMQGSHTTYASADAPKALVDVATTLSTLSISGAPSAIRDINVRIDAEHPAPQQAELYIVAPWGARTLLSDNRGNGSPIQGTVFDAEAFTAIKNLGSRPMEGRFFPEWGLGSLEDRDPNGTWRLEFIDQVAGSTGTLNGWSLDLAFSESGGDGADVIVGHGGVRDRVDYSTRTSGVIISTAGGANDGQSGEGDSVAPDVEDVYGGTGSDQIAGADATQNDLSGGAGADDLDGLGGDDVLRGDGGDDHLDGGAGADTLRGGAAIDTCVNGEILSECELPAATSMSCVFDAATKEARVTIAAPGDTARIGLGGSFITLNGTACGGATITSVDLVRVVDTSGGGVVVILDLGGGRFAPGADDEPGSSDEIEFSLELAGGTDRVEIAGGSTADLLTLGANGVNLAAGEQDGVDADVISSGVDTWVLQGGGGNDALSSAGGAGTGASQSRPVTLDGGSGADTLVSGTGPDVLSGGPGWDTLDYSTRLEDLGITIGDGPGDGAAGENDDAQGSIEAVLTGWGNDTLRGDDSTEYLAGGPGDDVIHGGIGDDHIDGGLGNDDINASAGDDLLSGGPGDDWEKGGGSNDTFMQTPLAHFSYDGQPTPIPDGGTLISRLAIAEAPGITYDVNVRIDIDHPATQQLAVTLISPADTRVDLSINRGNGSSFTGTHFDSDAVTTIRNAGTRSFEGRFHPEGSLENVDAQDPVGSWRLEVRDTVTGTVGALNWWALEIGFAADLDDGNDRLSGGVGDFDLLDYTARTQPVDVTLVGGADDGASTETDNAGDDLADIEDVYGGIGADSLAGHEGRNELRGQLGPDTLLGLGGNDVFRGGPGDDRIEGNLGNDLILPGLGDDTVLGGDGFDAVTYGAVTNGVNANLATGIVTGEGTDRLSTVESVTGTIYADTLTGGDSQDTLIGGGGNDKISGAGGHDTLNGGNGADQLDGGAGDDWVTYADAPGAVTVPLLGVSSGAWAGDTFANIENVIGSRFDDVITGSGASNTLNGGDGNDSIDGGLLHDTLNGGNGNDTLYGREGDDTLDGGSGSDQLDGGPFTDLCRNGETVVNCEL